MTDIPKYYWDVPIWIELINTQNPDWEARCIHVVDLATNNKAELRTSAFTLAAVSKKKCHGANVCITKNQGNCSGHLRTLLLAGRYDARSHIGAVAVRVTETTKTVEFMAGSANWDRKLT